MGGKGEACGAEIVLEEYAANFAKNIASMFSHVSHFEFAMKNSRKKRMQQKNNSTMKKTNKSLTSMSEWCKIASRNGEASACMYSLMTSGNSNHIIENFVPVAFDLFFMNMRSNMLAIGM